MFTSIRILRFCKKTLLKKQENYNPKNYSICAKFKMESTINNNLNTSLSYNYNINIEFPTRKKIHCIRSKESLNHQCVKIGEIVNPTNK